MKQLKQKNMDEVYAIRETQPWRVKSPNGVNVTGLTLCGNKIKDSVGAGQDLEPEKMEFMFLECGWAIKVGFQLINFAVKCGVLNLLKK